MTTSAQQTDQARRPDRDGEPGKHRAYERRLRRKRGIADTAAVLRAGGIQFVWLVVLVAGAAIPLTEALVDDGWEWVSPVLGFVVVIAAGLERIFRRTTDAAVALDRLRRNLSRERRLLIAGAGPYATAQDPYALYAESCEGFIATYDDAMVDYSSQAVRSTA